MTDIRRQLDQVVSNTLAQHIIPVKTAEGILVGSVLIESQGTVKHIKRYGQYLYTDISLNSAAVKIANLLARQNSSTLADKIYRHDQEYAKWFIDAQILLQQHYSSKKKQDFDKADMLWARYCESKNRAQNAKNSVTSLILF